MKRLSIILIAAILAGFGTHQLVLLREDPLAGNGADIAWLKSEFHLTEQQFQAILDLHKNYGAVCTGHCADILEARNHLRQLQASGADASTLAAAQAHIKELESICDNSTRAHLQEVARLMPPEEGARFLKLVEPFLATAPHDGARFPNH